MNKIEFVLGLEEKIEIKKQEFATKFNAQPTYIRIGYFVDMVNGSNIFSDGEKLCGLEVRRDDNNPITLEVGLSI